jgi:hypothetical protein
VDGCSVADFVFISIAVTPVFNQESKEDAILNGEVVPTLLRPLVRGWIDMSYTVFLPVMFFHMSASGVWLRQVAAVTRNEVI